MKNPFYQATAAIPKSAGRLPGGEPADASLRLGASLPDATFAEIKRFGKPTPVLVALRFAVLMLLVSDVSLPAQTMGLPQLTAVASGTGLQLGLRGETNRVYKIEASTNLINWT